MDEKIPVNKVVAFRIKQPFIGDELSDRAKIFSKINEDVIIYSEESFRFEPSYLRQFFLIQDRDKVKSFFTSSAKLIVIVKKHRKKQRRAGVFIWIWALFIKNRFHRYAIWPKKLHLTSLIVMRLRTFQKQF